MTARLPAKLLVTALIRWVQADGGFAAVLQKGDADSGSIMLQCTKKGRFEHLLERRMTIEGGYDWSVIVEADSKNTQELNEYLAKKRHNDPDMWLVELDIVNTERFIAELGTIG